MLYLGVSIVSIYWKTEQFSSIKQFSNAVVTYVFFYIILHMLKRFLWKRMRWWDYLYYLALISLIAPVLWANSANEQFFHWLTDIGGLLFILPILLDLYIWWLKFKKRTT